MERKNQVQNTYEKSIVEVYQAIQKNLLKWFTSRKFEVNIMKMIKFYSIIIFLFHFFRCLLHHLQII